MYSNSREERQDGAVDENHSTQLRALVERERICALISWEARHDKELLLLQPGARLLAASAFKSTSMKTAFCFDLGTCYPDGGVSAVPIPVDLEGSRLHRSGLEIS